MSGKQDQRWGGGRRLAAALALGVWTITGCAPQEGATGSAAAGIPPAGAAEDLYRVTADNTAFYRYGPQQPNGPDLNLKKDARLVMLKRSFGYSQVRTPDNQVGYVGTVDIGPISPEEMAAERAAQAALEATRAGGGRRSPAIVGEYTIPPQAGNQERLPEPEIKPAPNPAMFRY